MWLGYLLNAAPVTCSKSAGKIHMQNTHGFSSSSSLFPEILPTLSCLAIEH